MIDDRRPNKTLRAEVEESGLRYWELAQILGISESTMYRILRTPLSPEKTEQIRKLLGLKGKK